MLHGDVRDRVCILVHARDASPGDLFHVLMSHAWARGRGDRGCILVHVRAYGASNGGHAYRVCAKCRS